MDKLRAMTFFCRVVESRSLAAAAQALDVVPSALSKAISALERDLGFALLNRSTRGLSLTEEGALYYERCRQIIADVEAAESIGRRDPHPGRTIVESRGHGRVRVLPG